MANKAFVKDLSKAIKKSDLGGSQELTPGTTGRRFEPEGGVNSLNKRIHKESKFADDNKNLPFTFSKPKKAQRQIIVECKNCGALKLVNKTTVGVICSECKQYSGVEEINE